MRFVPIGKAVPGMVLSKAIFDSNYHTLLGAYMELTEEFIARLKARGLPGFYIEDDLTKDIIINEAISEELRSRALNCLAQKNIDATVNVAREIVEQLRNSDVISLDLFDLRTFDEYTYRHSVNVAVLSTVMGIGLNMQHDALIELCTAAILHDLGKLSISTAILNKPSRLTEEEFNIMRSHSNLSYELIKDIYDISAKTKVAVLFHHENEDGTGYPSGLKGDEIHIFAKIIHVADVYDALTTARPYKAAFSPLESAEYLVGGCGVLFDKTVVDCFMNYVPIYPKGVGVVLSSGKSAIVVENHLNKPFQPSVRQNDGSTIDLSSEDNLSSLSIVKLVDTADGMQLLEEGAKDTREHILAVDDMVSNLKALEGILKEKYKLSLAKSGRQALRFLKTHRPDLVLMDIDMPEMNGMDTVRSIRSEISKTIPIIFVTALSDRATVNKCKELNVQDYIVKPFKATYMLDRIEMVLSKRSLGTQHSKCLEINSDAVVCRNEDNYG